MVHSNIHNIRKFKDRRSTLRHNATSAEKYLWQSLRANKLLGRKFRRQHGIASYIVDFYCPSEKLIIELDGKVHNHPDQVIYDRRRDAFLKKLGFKILRIDNELVFSNIREVMRLIVLKFEMEGTEDGDYPSFVP